jgi:hypothetical protein
LSGAEGSEGDVAFDDLAGAGVGDGFAVAPAAGVAVDPLDDVVADVHGVGAFGEEIDAERVRCPAGGLKGLVPPAGAFEESGSDGFRCAAIDVVLDGGDGLAGVGAGGIFFDEAVADDEALNFIVAQRRCFIDIRGGEVAGAGIEGARGEAGWWEFDEGVALAEGDGVGIGGDVADVFAGGRGVGGEGEDGFDFRVFGECFGVIEGDGGAGGVDLVGALLEGGEGFGDVVGVVEEEVGGVDEDGGGMLGVGGVFGGDGEAPRGWIRERIG